MGLLRLVLAGTLCLAGCTSNLAGDGGGGPNFIPVPDAGPPVPDAGPACAPVSVALAEATPTIVLLVSRSQSMSSKFEASNRWSAVYSTLMHPVSGLVKELHNDARFGLSLYTGTDANPNCPILAEITPKLGNYDLVNGVYSAAAPIDDAPTGEALAATAKKMAQLTDSGPKVIILATDSDPDTCSAPDSDGGETAKSAAVAAARNAYLDGIATFVVGVGDQVSPQYLQDVATAGAGDVPAARYHQATDSGALFTAFDQIIGSIQQCTLTLGSRIDTRKAADGRVTMDGTELQYAADWDLLDSTTLRLIGSACDDMVAGDHQLDAEFSCDAIVP